MQQIVESKLIHIWTSFWRLFFSFLSKAREMKEYNNKKTKKKNANERSHGLREFISNFIVFYMRLQDS